jgi:uncharacterized protein
MNKPKPQRVRDPIHNLIEFDAKQFESTLWRVIQTPQFQRLRRIRQLGFSEFVFPGATHTRFAHSLGVFDTARKLMGVIEKFTNSHGQQFKSHQAQYSLTAALLHDVGHGMFSHAFESLGKEFGWAMARHEEVSQRLIRDSEITQVLDDSFGKGYAGNVADIIARDIPGDLYGAVVSSQFDADRLDYMQRDRFMTGVQSSGVDLTWLLANLEVAEVPTGADETKTETVETLVLGPKAVQTAESYVLGLFHLYPNVYLHKTTRGVEMMFQALIRRLVKLGKAGSAEASGLPARHPILRFLDDPTSLERALALDDAVLWGALPMMAEAEDRETGHLSMALRERRLPQCFDIRACVEELLPAKADETLARRQARGKVACEAIVAALRDRQAEEPEAPARVLVDQYSRNPYKRFQESKTPLNQILIRLGNGPPRDMGELSPTIGHAEPFTICRTYIFRGDTEAADMIENVMRTKIRETANGRS